MATRGTPSGRNPNGEGTIYQRKDGRFEAAAYVTTTDGGALLAMDTRDVVRAVSADGRPQSPIPIPPRRHP